MVRTPGRRTRSAGYAISVGALMCALALAGGASAAAKPARCNAAAASAEVERLHLGNAGYTPSPVAQVLCGAFLGPRSHAMVASLSIPSCGVSSGWVVFRSVGGAWRRAFETNHGAFLAAAGARIRETQGVLARGDAHCFPSSYRSRLWHWNGRRLVHGPWRTSAPPKLR
jgi:hypothetical protein